MSSAQLWPRMAWFKSPSPTHALDPPRRCRRSMTRRRSSRVPYVEPRAVCPVYRKLLVCRSAGVFRLAGLGVICARSGEPVARAAGGGGGDARGLGRHSGECGQWLFPWGGHWPPAGVDRGAGCCCRRYRGADVAGRTVSGPTAGYVAVGGAAGGGLGGARGAGGAGISADRFWPRGCGTDDRAGRRRRVRENHPSRAVVPGPAGCAAIPGRDRMGHGRPGHRRPGPGRQDQRGHRGP